MEKDNRIIQHGSDLEKVLVYKYNRKTDTLEILNIDQNVKTKKRRVVLNSKNFRLIVSFA